MFAEIMLSFLISASIEAIEMLKLLKLVFSIFSPQFEIR